MAAARESEAEKVWAVLRHTAIPASGFLFDAYNFFIVNIAVEMMKDATCDMSLPMESWIKSMAIVGSIFGKLVFGYLADHWGRRKVFLLTCVTIICGAFMSGLVFDAEGFGLYPQLLLWRFVIGLGIGGEYPLTAALTTEGTIERDRGRAVRACVRVHCHLRWTVGLRAVSWILIPVAADDMTLALRMLAAVFSMQGLGQFSCAVFCALIAYTVQSSDMQWRLVYALGAAPLVPALYYRWKMPDSEQWQRSLEQQKHETTGPQTAWYKMRRLCKQLKGQRWRLAGTSVAWLLTGFIFYGHSLFEANIMAGLGGGTDVKSKVYNFVIIQAIALLGCLLPIFYMDRVGTKNLQASGFAVVALLFCIMALFQKELMEMAWLYVTIYGLVFFFLGFGPNTTTYVIPATIFPTEVRATANGISAAAGKIGALVGTMTLRPLKGFYCPRLECTSDSHSDPSVRKGLGLLLSVCAAVAAMGCVWTLIFVDDEPLLKEENGGQAEGFNGAVRMMQGSDGLAAETKVEEEDTEPDSV